MSKRIALACILVAAALSGQEEKDVPVLRVYDLSPLVTGNMSSFYATRPGPSQREFSLLGSSQVAEGERMDDSVDDEVKSPADMVIDLIRTFVGDVEGIFELELIDGGRRLMARMKEADQKIVARVLEQLRDAGDPPVEIAVRHLSIRDRMLDDNAREMLLKPGGLDANRLKSLARFDLHGGQQGGTIEIPLGRWGVYRAVRELRYVPDFDVEIAQAASIADPLPAIFVDGLKAAIRPFLLRDGRLLLRVVASAGDRVGEPRRFLMGASENQDQLRLRNTDYNDLEQCDYRGAAVSTEVVVTPGKPAAIVLATQAGEDVRWDVLSLEVGEAPGPVHAETFAITPVGALSAADIVRVVRWNAWTGELGLVPDGEPVQRIELDTIVEALGTWGFFAEREGEFRTSEQYLYGGSVLLRGNAADLGLAHDGIASLERELIRPARLDVLLRVEQPGGESRTVGALSAPMTLARRAALAAYLRMDTVGDYDVEIAQEARIADPCHTVETAGAFANADLFRNPDGTYRLQLELTVSGAPEGIRTSATRAGGIPFVQSVQLSKCVVPVRLDLVAGRTRNVTLGPDPFTSDGDGRLVAAITVQ